MSSVRFSGVLFVLFLSACGGSSKSRAEDEGEKGGAGGLGGSGAETGGGGQGATGGSGVGGSGAAGLGPLEGDYRIESNPSSVYYATVTSPTKALVGREYEEAYDYDILQTPRAALAPGQGSFPPTTELAAEYVLRRADGEPSALAFALETNESTTRALIGFRSRPCHGQENYTVVTATATRDTDPPDSRLSPDWGIAPPWRTFFVAAERPVLAPLSAGFQVTANGEPVAVTWFDSTVWYATAAAGTLDDWPSLVDQTLEVRGDLHGTNGTNATVLATARVPDFGMHEGPVTFAELPPDVALWGGASHHAAGQLGSNCPDGCVQLGGDAGVGMRFLRPGRSLRVTATFNGLLIQIMTPDGTTAIVPTPTGTFGSVETADIALPVEAEDLFVVFQGPPPIVAGGCPTPSNLEFLASVEPAGVP